VTRKQGQVTTLQVLLATVAIITVLTVAITGLTVLVQRVEDTPHVDAVVADDDVVCPDREQFRPRQTVDVASGELIECPREFDGITVTYTGEAIRAVLDRGDHAWVHVNDDAYASGLGPIPEHRISAGANSGIPVRMSSAQGAAIRFVGDGHHVGDQLLVTGTFYRAHPDASGGPAIHADEVDVIGAGRPIERPVGAVRALLAATLLLVAGMLAQLARRARRQG
jgi:hypothetical protein